MRISQYQLTQDILIITSSRIEILVWLARISGKGKSKLKWKIAKNIRRWPNSNSTITIERITCITKKSKTITSRDIDQQNRCIPRKPEETNAYSMKYVNVKQKSELRWSIVRIVNMETEWQPIHWKISG